MTTIPTFKQRFYVCDVFDNLSVIFMMPFDQILCAFHCFFIDMFYAVHKVEWFVTGVKSTYVKVWIYTEINVAYKTRLGFIISIYVCMASTNVSLIFCQ